MKNYRTILLTLFTLGLGLVTSHANAITVAQFTGGEFFYDGTTNFGTTTTFNLPGGPSTQGPSNLDSITNPLGFVGTATRTLDLSGVTSASGWVVSSSGATGEQLFTGGIFTLSDNSGTLLTGTMGNSALTAATGGASSTIFNFSVVTYTYINPILGTGLTAPLPGDYTIGMEFLNGYTTPTTSTAAGLAAFDATGVGTFSAIPVPAAVWLFGSGLLGLVGIARRKQV